jgi:hypothetical protein
MPRQEEEIEHSSVLFLAESFILESQRAGAQAEGGGKCANEVVLAERASML